MFSGSLERPSLSFYMYTLTESLLLLPLFGLLLPHVLACYSLYTIVSSVVTFHLMIKEEKEVMREKVARKYMEEMKEHFIKKRLPRDALHNRNRKVNYETYATSHTSAASTAGTSAPTVTAPKHLHPNPLVPTPLHHTLKSSHSLNLLSTVISSSASSSQDITELIITGSSAYYLDKTTTALTAETLNTAVSNPRYFADVLLSKKRTILALLFTGLYLFRLLLGPMLGYATVRKAMIVLSTTLPSLHVQYNLLFSEFHNRSSGNTYSPRHQASFTIHSLCLIFLSITVGHEVPWVYDKLVVLFECVYSNVFPVGVIISVLEGWRCGVNGGGRGRAGSVDVSVDVNANESVKYHSPASSPQRKRELSAEKSAEGLLVNATPENISLTTTTTSKDVRDCWSQSNDHNDQTNDDDVDDDVYDEMSVGSGRGSDQSDNCNVGLRLSVDERFERFQRLSPDPEHSAGNLSPERTTYGASSDVSDCATYASSAYGSSFRGMMMSGEGGGLDEGMDDEDDIGLDLSGKEEDLEQTSMCASEGSFRNDGEGEEEGNPNEGNPNEGNPNSGEIEPPPTIPRGEHRGGRAGGLAALNDPLRPVPVKEFLHRASFNSSE
jgi:hypothetical protein